MSDFRTWSFFWFVENCRTEDWMPLLYRAVICRCWRKKSKASTYRSTNKWNRRHGWKAISTTAKVRSESLAIFQTMGPNFCHSVYKGVRAKLFSELSASKAKYSRRRIERKHRNSFRGRCFTINRLERNAITNVWNIILTWRFNLDHSITDST